MTQSNRQIRVQSGFTLIELMVVMVIMSVVVSVAVISLGGNEQTTLRAQQSSAKALLTFVRDKSAIKQQMYLVAPDKAGLTTYVLKTGKWQVDNRIEKLAWQEGLDIEWQVDNTAFAQQQNLPSEGWVFWPSGDVLGGAIYMRSLQTKQATGPQDWSSYSFSWNEVLQFSSLDSDDL